MTHHHLVGDEQVGSDDGSRVNQMPLDAVVVPNALPVTR